MQVKLDASSLTAGTWTVGVLYQETTKKPFKYQLVVNLNDCPQGCSQHGVCDVTSHKCTCDEGYRAFADCSLADRELHQNDKIELQVKSYEMQYYHVQVNSKVAAGEVELVAMTTQKDKGSDVFPMLYMSLDKAPTREDADFVSPGNNVTVITLSPSELKAGTWYLGLFNPNYQTANFSVSVFLQGRCLNACSNHGTCDTLSGAVCQCSDGWLGGDCSVAASKAGGGGGGGSESSGGGVGGGTVFLLIVLFFGLGVGAGIYAKKTKPHLCGDVEETAGGARVDQEAGYMEDHMTMSLGADYITMQGENADEETR